MNKFLSPKPIALQSGIAFVRIITALFMIYHGWEVFDAAKMKEYSEWELFKNSSSPLMMVYIGKSAELIAGIMLLLGFLTRIAAIILIFTMSYITFFIGNGKIWYGDQHPFLFVLLGFLFLFAGPGKYSIDNLLFKKS